MPEQWIRTLHIAAHRFRETAHLMVGLPDYQRYRLHVESHHPGTPPMSHTEFVRETMARRYSGRGPGRCC
jgi:uncharacterized short protein YbdD (DUF466 family)